MLRVNRVGVTGEVKAARHGNASLGVMDNYLGRQRGFLSIIYRLSASIYLPKKALGSQCVLIWLMMSWLAHAVFEGWPEPDPSQERSHFRIQQVLRAAGGVVGRVISNFVDCVV